MTDLPSNVTISEDSVFELTEKKSRFIACARHIESENDAVLFVDDIRKDNPFAKHVAFAYSLNNGVKIKCSDDGEPQGSAGLPVLNVIKISGINDICIAVVRYFGGILLGFGGLTRAYSSAAAGAVDKAKKALKTEYTEFDLTVDYSVYQNIMKLTVKNEIEIINSDFSDIVNLNMIVRSDLYNNFERTVTDMTRSKSLPGNKKIIERLNDI